MESGWRHLVNSFWKQPVASLAKTSAHLYRWFQTPVGRYMLAQELELIEQCRKEYKGRVMLQVSAAGEPLLGQPNRKRLKLVVSPNSRDTRDSNLQSYSWLTSELDALPLEEGSVDFLILHHSLEFSENPHAVLREAVRVLSPRGHIIIICFNPYSLFSLRKSMQLVLRKVVPWAHHGLSRGRIFDWLKLMNCEPLNVAWGFYSFPIQSEKILKYTNRLDSFLTQGGIPGGGFYVVHACKEIGGWIGSIDAEDRAAQQIKFPEAAATRNFKENN